MKKVQGVIRSNRKPSSSEEEENADLTKVKMEAYWELFRKSWIQPKPWMICWDEIHWMVFYLPALMPQISYVKIRLAPWDLVIIIKWCDISMKKYREVLPL